MLKQSNSGIITLGLLGIVFVTLKLTDVIDWSWWYVTMPFYGSLAVVILFGVPLYLYALHVDSNQFNEKRRPPKKYFEGTDPKIKENKFQKKIGEAMEQAELQKKVRESQN